MKRSAAVKRKTLAGKSIAHSQAAKIVSRDGFCIGIIENLHILYITKYIALAKENSGERFRREDRTAADCCVGGGRAAGR
jgi:hypothetical protein